MHRSGTSLTASLLQSVGVDIGKNLVGAADGNIKGHFENIDFVDFHKEVLRSHKLDQQGFTLKSEIPVAESFIEKAQNIIRQNSQIPVWGWKDPRTTLFLDFWIKLLPNANFIFVYRSPWEVVDSLYRRGTDEILLSKPQLALLAWIHYNKKVLEFSEKYPKNSLIVNINTIAQDYLAFVQGINEKFKVNLKLTGTEIFDPSLLVDKIYQTHRPSLIEKCFPEAVEIYQELNSKALGLVEKPSIFGKRSSVLWEFQDWLTIRLLEKKRKGLQTELKQWQDQFQESQAKVLELETTLGKTQGQLDQREIKLQEALAKLLELETTLGKTQGQLDGTQNQLNSVQVELSHTRTENAALAGEIAAMKYSKLWQLRQKYLALKRRLRYLIKPFIFAIDFPTSWNIANGNFQICGWCCNTQSHIQTIRARVGEQIFPGNYGMARSDVAAAYREIKGAEASGFAIPVSLNSGRHNLVLEALTEPGKWQRFASYSLVISPLEAAIDAPKDWEQKSGTILFSGWCCHPQQKIEQLVLCIGDISFECAYGNYRPDVGKAYPDWKDSAASGWEATVAIGAGNWQVFLKATLENGEVALFQAPLPLIVRRDLALGNWKNQLQTATRFVEVVRKKIYERRIRLGGRLLPNPGEIPRLVGKIISLYREQQSKTELATPGFNIPQPIEPYSAWLQVNQWNQKAEAYLLARLNTCRGTLAKISVVMPVYNTPVEFLERAIASVTNQVYQNWELCIADDYSTNPDIPKTLQKWLVLVKDNRIRVIYLPKNGNISAATNSAASLATGDYLVFLDHDDELTPDALGEVALYLAENPETDFLYSDDDKIDINGQRYAPQFKPDWSPELLLSYMYFSHLCAVKRNLFETLGGMRVGFEGSQDYDFALRVTEKTNKIAHLPLVLYHWRATPGSTAITGAAKPKSFIAGEKAVQEALQRRGIKGTAYQPEWALRLGLGLYSHKFPDTGPSVAIVIPTKNQVSLLQNCLTSLEKTTYQNYQVLVVDNESDEAETLAYLEQIPHRVLKVKNPDGKFNFAAINNRAAEQVETDYLLFLNNDTQVISPDWLSQMIGYAQIEGVGAVGARLLFPDGRVQHAGVIHGMHHGLAGHAFKLINKDDGGYLSYAKVTRNYSAVTAACLLTPRQLFLELGGFDEIEFAVAYNDADYGYRLLEKGYRSVYCTTAEFIHYEGSTRGFSDNPKERANYRQKYGKKVDCFYSPHLSLENEQVQIQARRIFLPVGAGFTNQLAESQDISLNPPLLVKPAFTPLKILMCSNDLNFTGAPLHQYEIAVNLAKKGAIKPIAFCVNEGPLREVYQQQGIEVIVREHPLANIYTRGAYDEALEKLGEEIKQLDIDLIYANTLNNFFMVDCAKKIGIPCVWNLHESEPWQTYFNHFGAEIASRALECFAYPYQIVFVADATRESYLPLNTQHNFTVIHNGLDIERLDAAAPGWTKSDARKSLGVEPEEVVILLLGTVCDRKGQQDLVRALSHLPKQHHTNIRCFIVGDRPNYYSRQLAKLAAELPSSLQQRLTIVPETADTARYYQAADIFVCTSRIESYPRVILEAMAYNLPIITTPVFGIKEQVLLGINGIFYTPGNAAELANGIASLLDNKSLRQQMAQNSRYVLQSLTTFDEMTQAYAQIFREAYLSQK
ncbi:glycosyltransferase [Microseira sp. BLCC-F43]|uniref:glycosyltransferase n=1 Tax=Microseira sp. BLCC-F43 TaxID=3153602 RepID=UPI0035B9F905